MSDQLGNEAAEQRKQEKKQKRAEKLAKLLAKKEILQNPAPAKAKKQPTTPGYDPVVTEREIRKYWAETQPFVPREGDRQFVICIPPPNVTGSLHIGHAMMISVEDCIVRYKRLNGYEVLYLPGLDHAGIATQSVVMKTLQQPVDRETFLDAAHSWTDKCKDRIYEQFDRMGASVDYTRKVFTLDSKVNRSVNTAFCRLYEKGLIYREKKIVSWCGKLKTTLSDIEVNYKEVEGRSKIEVDGGVYTFGLLYYIKYYLTRSRDADLSGIDRLPHVVIATTRPETILGDSAICINPNDGRFGDLDKVFRDGTVEDVLNESNRISENTQRCEEAGNADDIELRAERKNKFRTSKTVADADSKQCELFAINPVTHEVIPVIFDAQADLSFGTGVLKVTPSHDPVDFKLGKKHGLEFKRVIGEDNRICHSRYRDMMRFEARQAIVEDLKKSGMYVKEEAHKQIMPFCSRSNDVIESVVKDQWWCECKGMAERALKSVRSGEIDIQPEEARGVWYRWLENIKDWCLSRQLWWGHRVPAYRAEKDGREEWIVAETEEMALAMAKSKGYERIEQDEDVLDTWFSSGLWPFSTLGWPDETADLARYFPTTLLETGSDILFFWVARMVMLSYELTGQRPFSEVFLHGIVRDAHGRKMSKSLGNVIDPLYVIDGIGLDEMVANLSKGNLDPREVRRATDALKKDFPHGIPRCGADALRFTLLSYTNGMKDINLDILRVQGYSRLCNKMFNAFKFVAGRGGLESLSLQSRPHHKWILARLNTTVAEQHRAMQAYDFMAATQSAYALFFDFCDCIIEVSKNTTGDAGLLTHVFVSILQIFHPFMPFITEDLHIKLTSRPVSGYPVPVSGDLENSFGDVLELARVCRASTRVQVVDFEDAAYLRGLTRGNYELVESLVDAASIGALKYKIVE